MHTVLMLNQEAKKMYETFSFLFTPFKKEISICYLDETADDPNRIFPGLADMVAGKGPWRAFLFATEPLQAVGEGNPFDFAKETPFLPTEESPERLIQLTHFLGGFPAKNTYNFEAYYFYVNKEGEKIEGKEDDPHFRAQAQSFGVPIQKGYRKIQLESLEQVRGLIQKYDALAHKPEELYLVKLRQKPVAAELEVLSPATFKSFQLETSFVEDNNYPSLCRFLVFDLQRVTKYNENAQLFHFWLSLLTLLSNRFGTNLFQAHALYRFKCHLNHDKLTSAFSQKLSYNEEVIKQIKETLTRPLMFSNEYGDELIAPEPVHLHYDRLDQQLASLNLKAFDWAKEIPALDEEVLESQVEQSISNLKYQLKEPRRRIANAAKETRLHANAYFERELMIDDHQVQDILEQMDVLQEEIFNEISIRYLYDDSFTSELVETKDVLKQGLNRRLFSTGIFLVAGMVLLTVLISYFIIFLHTETIGNVIWEGLLLLGLTAVSIVAVILYHRRLTRRYLGYYNEEISQVYGQIRQETDQIKRRLEKIYHYMCAVHLVEYQKATDSMARQAEFNLKQYLMKLNQFNQFLEVLGREMSLNIQRHGGYDQRATFDPDIPLRESPLFTFTSNKVTELTMPSYDVAWKIPYDGISGIEIEKVETTIRESKEEG